MFAVTSLNGSSEQPSASPIRVLHLAAGNLYGGVETFLATLARYRRVTPEVESEFALCFPGRLHDELAASGAFVRLLGETQLRSPWTVARANRRLHRLIRERDYRAVVMHGAWPHVLFGVTTKLNRRALVTWGHGAPLNPGPLDYLAERIKPDLVIANSHYTAGALRRFHPSAPTVVIYCPVEQTRTATRERSDVRAALQTREDALVIAFAGRLERWKGHSLLLSALNLLKEDQRWRLWLAGGAQREHEKQYLEELQSYVRHHGMAERVQFLGQRGDVAALLRAADIFCQPNTGPEPFGIVFVEALYAGLPVVTTRMGGGAEIVDETCGLLVEPTPDAVAGALRSLLDDAEHRKRLSRLAPRRAQSLCAPEERVKEIARALERASRVAVGPH